MNTKHAPDCHRAFRHLDPTCPRCKELAAGAPPRSGWTDHRRAFEAASLEAIRRHDCKAAHCGPVCTFGDW